MDEKKRAEHLAASAPPLTPGELEQLNGLYPAYLFRNRKGRELWTSCCGRHERAPKGEDGEAVAEVMEAEHQREIVNTYWRPNPERQKTLPCPFCGRKAVVKELGRTGKRDNLCAWKRAVVLRWYRGALWVRAYDTCKKYRDERALTARPDWTLEAVYRIVPGKVEFAEKRWGEARVGGYKVWTNAARKDAVTVPEPFRYSVEYGMGYDLIGVEELEKSPLRWCGFSEFEKRSEKVIRFLAVCAFWPRQVEMLIKAGLVDAVKDLVDRNVWNAKGFDWDEPDPWKAFGLTKPELREFLAGERDLAVLAAYKRLKKAGGLASLEELYELKREAGNMTQFQRVVSRLKKYRLSYRKLHCYLDRERKTAQGRKKAGPPPADVMGWWVDYIDAAVVLGYDLTNPVFLTPKELSGKHDKATRAAAAILEGRRSDERKAHERERLARLVPRYTYWDDRYLIRPPLGAAEIVAEGKALKHCVGGYADRHVEGKTAILFLRDKLRPGKHLVTIEMHGNELVQIHGWDDERTACKENPKRVSPRELYADFLEPWLAWVAAGSKRDKRGRPRADKKDRKEHAA